jgi:galactose mutarotase-like enzyme
MTAATAASPHRFGLHTRGMAAPTNALNSGDRLPLVAPGERYTARFAITVEHP